MALDGILGRIKDKAHSNQLAVAVGGQFAAEVALPGIAKPLQQQFDTSFPVSSDYEYYARWSEFIDQLEKSVD